MTGDLNLENNKITNLCNPRSGTSDGMSYSHFQSRFFSEGQNNDINCNGKRLYSITPNTNRDKLIERGYLEDYYFQINTKN